MTETYPAIRIKMPFTRARAVLYEDYLAVEHLHSLGMSSEESRTYYDEVRWVMKYQARDWYRMVHAVLLAFPLGLGVILLAVGEHWILSTLGLVLTLAAGVWILFALYHCLFVPRGVAAVLSARGTIYIGTDWPRSSNRMKDAAAFFETFLGKLKLVEEMPSSEPAIPAAPPPSQSAPPEEPEPPAPGP